MLNTKIIKNPPFNSIFNLRKLFYAITIEYSCSEVLKKWFLSKNQLRSTCKKVSLICEITLSQKFENTFSHKNFCHG